MREIVIDLSVVDAAQSPAPPRSRRWLAALTVALVTLMGATAAQPAPEPYFHRLMWIEAPARDIMALSPNLLVLHERGRSLVAYTLDGRLAWRRDFLGLQLKRASIRDGAVIVNAIDLPSSENRTIFIDAATGAETWRADGDVSMVDGYIVVNSPGPQRRLRVLHAPDRAEVWRLPADRIPQGVRPGKVYSLGPGGLFTEHDLATGEPRRTLTLSPTGLDRISITAGDDYGEIVRLDRREPAEHIDLRTFTLGQSTAQLWAGRFGCGPVTCAYGMQGQQVVLDKLTGRVLWQVPPGQGLIPTPAGLLATNAGSLSMADFYTGKGETLLRWQLVTPAADADVPRLLVRNRIGETAADFAELRPSGLRLASALPIVVNTCWQSGDIVACVTAGQKAGAWRITAADYARLP